MTGRISSRGLDRGVLLIAAAVTGVLLSGCGSGSTGATATPAASVSASASASTSASMSPSRVAAASGAVTVRTHAGPLGAYLTDGAGRTLYLFTADARGKSTCAGSCATFWPPLETTGVPKTAGAAKSSLTGTTSRSDGSKQVTYAGHPVYYFSKDTAAGQMKGQGSTGSGAKWWILSPAGAAITKMAP